jgi:hypothetical protein
MYLTQKGNAITSHVGIFRFFSKIGFLNFLNLVCFKLRNPIFFKNRISEFLKPRVLRSSEIRFFSKIGFLNFLKGYLYTPLGLKIVVETPTLKGLNVATDEIGGT